MSAVVAAGVSTVGLLATLSLITTSMKAGRRAQGLADAGALSDSIRTVLRAQSGTVDRGLEVPGVALLERHHSGQGLLFVEQLCSAGGSGRTHAFSVTPDS